MWRLQYFTYVYPPLPHSALPKKNTKKTKPFIHIFFPVPFPGERNFFTVTHPKTKNKNKTKTKKRQAARVVCSCVDPQQKKRGVGIYVVDLHMYLCAFYVFSSPLPSDNGAGLCPRDTPVFSSLHFLFFKKYKDSIFFFFAQKLFLRFYETTSSNTSPRTLLACLENPPTHTHTHTHTYSTTTTKKKPPIFLLTPHPHTLRYIILQFFPPFPPSPPPSHLLSCGAEQSHKFWTCPLQKEAKNNNNKKKRERQ